MSNLEKVIEIIARETGESVTAETRLDSLPIDSLEFLDLFLEIERETGISSEASMAFETVGDFAK